MLGSLGRVAIVSSCLVAATVAAITIWPVPVHASGVICLLTDPETGQCQLEARWEQPSGGPVVLSITSGGGGTLEKCQRPVRTVADAQQGDAIVDCYGGSSQGWCIPKYDCYLLRAEEFDLVANEHRIAYLEGAKPGDDGALYLAQCLHEHYATSDGWFDYYLWFLPSPPPGYGGQPDPTADLIVEAVNQLQLRGPDIGTAPPENGAGLVGMPVWFWTEVTEQTWGTPVATATAMGITVTAHAEASHIQWQPGDGSDPITCDAGKPWQPGDDVLDPPCGHTYATASRYQPDGRFAVTATTTWEVTWSIAGGPSDGASGTITLTPQSETTLRINELQVLVS